MRLFDSHAHYFDRRFEEAGGADCILQKLFSGDVSGIINVGTNPENGRICIEQAARYPKMYAAVGIHPEDLRDMVSMEDELKKLSALLGTAKERRERKIVALGEIGLDYHWEGYSEKKQKEYFAAQMELAEMEDLPVIIHDREAHGDCFDMICRYSHARGVFHSYSGSAEMAEQLCRRGWYISFSGVLTFRNARRVREVAEKVPLDRLLIETDAPYLAPEPHRGKLNHSGLMRHTVEALAEVLGKSAEEVGELTYRNACRLFSLPI